MSDTINTLIKSGAFSSKSDFVRHAIRSWFEKNEVKIPDDEIEISYGVPRKTIEEIRKHANSKN